MCACQHPDVLLCAACVLLRLAGLRRLRVFPAAAPAGVALVACCLRRLLLAGVAAGCGGGWEGSRRGGVVAGRMGRGGVRVLCAGRCSAGQWTVVTAWTLWCHRGGVRA
jgi:hypothetical protein